MLKRVLALAGREAPEEIHGQSSTLLIFDNFFCSWQPVAEHTKVRTLAPSSAISDHVQACLGPTDCDVEQVGTFCGPILGSLALRIAAQHRSEERRVGQECVSTGSSRWSPDH